MHPEVRQTEPGNCPICGMDLILDQNTAPDSAQTALEHTNSLHLSRSVNENLGLQTVQVESGLVNLQIQLPGKIELDPTKSVRMSTYIAGRIDQLLVNFEGAYVEKGEVVATLYSPQMITAQQEFLTLIENNPSRVNLIESAQTKLERLGFSEEDISKIKQTKRPTINIELRARYLQLKHYYTLENLLTVHHTLQLVKLVYFYVIVNEYHHHCYGIRKMVNCDLDVNQNLHLYHLLHVIL